MADGVAPVSVAGWSALLRILFASLYFLFWRLASVIVNILDNPDRTAHNRMALGFFFLFVFFLPPRFLSVFIISLDPQLELGLLCMWSVLVIGDGY